MSKVLRLVIADDSYLVREGTSRLLEEGGAVEVVAAVGTAADLIDAVNTVTPSAVITDITMPTTGHRVEDRIAGITAAHAIRATHPDIGVVVLSQYAAGHYAFELFKNGTAGLAYLLKDRVGDRAELLRAIHATISGGSVVDPLVVDGLVQRTAAPTGAGLNLLSPREIDVLRHMAQGASNSAIAAALHLSESGVEKHVGSIFLKLDLVPEPEMHRRVAAVLAFLRGLRDG